MEAQVDFTSLGTTVLDEIHFPSSEPVRNVLGGSGVFCVLGARLFLDSPRSKIIGWMIRHGTDFPASIKQNLLRWDTTLLMRTEEGKRSTSSLLKYEDDTFGAKTFRFLTEVLTIEPNHLIGTPLLQARVFHLMTAPTLAEEYSVELARLRREAKITDNFLIIWEPAPPSCRPENLDACLQAAKSVDVFSPNHIELAALFAVEQAETFDRSQFENLASRVLASGVGIAGDGTVVVRAGAAGCCICSRSMTPIWLPAYHHSLSSPDIPGVVDATGAGNAFLGGFAVGYLESGDVIEAGRYGAVSASFALEQVGAPKLNISSNGRQTWNGDDARTRLVKYKEAFQFEK